MEEINNKIIQESLPTCWVPWWKVRKKCWEQWKSSHTHITERLQNAWDERLWKLGDGRTPACEMETRRRPFTNSPEIWKLMEKSLQNSKRISPYPNTLFQEGRIKGFSNVQGLNAFYLPFALVLEIPGKRVSSEKGRRKKEEDSRARKRECT